MSKNLVLCCDGTNNQFAGDHTNVIRTYKVARRPQGQLTYYDPGVGTMPEPWWNTWLDKHEAMLRGLIYGDGFMDNILDAYRFLVVNYNPGDNIYLFGFSRGAFTARAVAAMLHSIGLVYPATENLLSLRPELLAEGLRPAEQGRENLRRIQGDTGAILSSAFHRRLGYSGLS